MLRILLQMKSMGKITMRLRLMKQIENIVVFRQILVLQFKVGISAPKQTCKEAVIRSCEKLEIQEVLEDQKILQESQLEEELTIRTEI